MKTDSTERRRYRFRAWHKLDRELYPVLMVGRGGVLLQDKAYERTCPNADVVLMQYSGLSDVTGREIYEGDIVTLGHQVYTVVLQDGAFRLQDDDQTEPLQQGIIIRQNARVIGNIYQNTPAKPARS